ncbi:hypothetical protein BOX15_Mlig028483g3, partial [Macrostomum lignano]
SENESRKIKKGAFVMYNDENGKSWIGCVGKKVLSTTSTILAPTSRRLTPTLLPSKQQQQQQQQQQQLTASPGHKKMSKDNATPASVGSDSRTSDPVSGNPPTLPSLPPEQQQQQQEFVVPEHLNGTLQDGNYHLVPISEEDLNAILAAGCHVAVVDLDADAAVDLDADAADAGSSNAAFSGKENSSKQRGVNYICPFKKPSESEGQQHGIFHSRIRQHLRESHKDILGSKNIDDLVAEIKVFNQQEVEDDSSRKVKCPDCDVLFEKRSMTAHRVRFHYYKPAEAAAKKAQEKFDALKKSIDAKKEATLLEVELSDLAKWLPKWEGGGLKASSIRKNTDALSRLAKACGLTDLLSILTEEFRDKVSAFVEEDSKRNKSADRSCINALTHLVSFFRARRFVELRNLGLKCYLLEFEERLKRLTKAYGLKVRRPNDARLRNVLDKELLKPEEVESLHSHVHSLITRAESAAESNILSNDVIVGITTSMCFSNGNASRPDIPTNATIEEGLEWLTDQKSEFFVKEHKTSNMYGACRVAVDSVAEILANYIQERAKTASPTDRLFPLGTGGFARVWTRERAKNSKIEHVTNTAYRKFIETYSAMYLDENQQKAVSIRLCHKPNVARQSYQATMKSMSMAARFAIGGIISGLANMQQPDIVGPEAFLAFVRGPAAASHKSNTVNPAKSRQAAAAKKRKAETAVDQAKANPAKSRQAAAAKKRKAETAVDQAKANPAKSRQAAAAKERPAETAADQANPAKSRQSAAAKKRQAETAGGSRQSK